MNGLRGSRAELGAVIAARPACEVVICPPATLIAEFADMAAGVIRIGAQDCHPLEAGAHTGELSAEMLRDCGADFVICGHSERRQDQGEGDDLVCAKAEAALRTGLEPIICVGESEAERKNGETLAVLSRQIGDSVPKNADQFLIAYEPIWAIGAGRAASARDIEQAHGHIRSLLGKIPVLYGGSVQPDNAAEIAALENVNGLLIGGASLKASSFLSIIGLCKRFY